MTNEEFQKLILEKLSGLETNMSSIKTELSDLKAQQQENTDLINALIHDVTVANAKLDGLTTPRQQGNQ